MDHYLDIRLLPDADFSAPVLLNTLYAKLHRALAAQQRCDIGISFPGYAPASGDSMDKPVPTLGLTLRLHGRAAALDSLITSRWLSGFADYAMTGEIRPVPDNAHAIRVVRRQSKSNPAKERERLMRRKHMDQAEAQRRIPDCTAKRLHLPFITLDSVSTGQRFLLFIEQHEVQTVADGDFNAYGLSHNATLPMW